MDDGLDFSDDPQFESLTTSLETAGGDFAAALTLIGLQLELDAEGNIVRILDPMLNGSLDDQDFALLAQISTLKRVWIRGARITDEGLAILEKMPQLTELSLAADGITDKGLRHLRHLLTLESLHLEKTQIDGSGLIHLLNPEKITWLDFTHSLFNDNGLKILARFSNLDTLGLWGTQITDAGLTHLKACKQLMRLNLYETAITNSGIEELAKIPSLEDLDLSETAVTDECLDDLLSLPQLKEVSFGSEQISVSALEQLEAAGISVQHDKLLNVVRTENLLRFMGMDFEVDPGQSSIRAYMNPTDPGVGWAISVACTDKYVPDYMQPAHLDGPAFSSFKSWKELPGEEFVVAFEESELHPILPDNPCNLYVGWHAAPNHHRIHFLKRNGNNFLIDWHCVAKESPQDEGVPVWVHAEIPFREVIVWSDAPITMEDVQRLFKQYFTPTDFHAPEIVQNEFDTRFVFRVRSSND